ncbi:hypothetical protein imdm_1885 [gamma proteobacterium IMCC2047]|nr:hypothetical protein imdm_1885 [gamma proteobacterium IMCC2047]
MFDKQSGWANIRINGRQYVENERNWANSVANYQPLYSSLVG